MRKEISAIAPGLPLTCVQTMGQQIDESGGVSSLRVSAYLATALGALGLALAPGWLVWRGFLCRRTTFARNRYSHGIGTPKNAVRWLVPGQASLFFVPD